MRLPFQILKSATENTESTDGIYSGQGYGGKVTA